MWKLEEEHDCQNVCVVILFVIGIIPSWYCLEYHRSEGQVKEGKDK